MLKRGIAESMSGEPEWRTTRKRFQTKVNKEGKGYFK